MARILFGYTKYVQFRQNCPGFFCKLQDQSDNRKYADNCGESGCVFGNMVSPACNMVNFSINCNLLFIYIYEPSLGYLLQILFFVNLRSGAGGWGGERLQFTYWYFSCAAFAGERLYNR